MAQRDGAYASAIRSGADERRHEGARQAANFKGAVVLIVEVFHYAPERFKHALGHDGAVASRQHAAMVGLSVEAGSALKLDTTS